MKVFFSEKRSRCRVAIGRSGAIIGKISFFNDGSTDGSILCVRDEEEFELSQLLLSPPAAVVILGGEQSRSIGLFCSIGVPCIILDEDEEIGNDYKNRVALIDTERQIIIFDPSIETLNFYSNNFKSEKELSRLGCDLGAIIEELPEVEFSSEIKKKAERQSNGIYKGVVPHDIVKFGLIPELVGRIPVIVPLDDLDKDALVRILKEPKNSIVKQYIKLIEMDGVELKFDDEALEAVAKLAIERNTGARGLRSIMENLMMSVMYDIPSRDNVASVIIGADCVNGLAAPQLVEKELVSLDNPIAGSLE